MREENHRLLEKVASFESCNRQYDGYTEGDGYVHAARALHTFVSSSGLRVSHSIAHACDHVKCTRAVVCVHVHVRMRML
eukprot:2618129-Prymnesium_polylepis.2